MNEKLQKLYAKSDLLFAKIEEFQAKETLTEAEQTEYKNTVAEAKKVEADIDTEKEVEALAEKRNQPENKPFRSFAEPKSHAPKWNSLGEFFGAVAKAGSPGGSIDNRLIMNAASGNNTNVGSEGGFMIEKENIDSMMDAVQESAEVANKITMVPVSGNNNGIKWRDIKETSRADGSRHGGALVYWAAEAETVSSSKIQTVKGELELEKLFGLWYATDELLQDAAAMEKLARMEFGNAMSFVVDDAIINGSGVGKPLGILNSSALISIAKESGQGADTIVHENIQKMWNRLSVKSRKNAIWYINQEIEPQLENMILPIGTAGTVSPLAKEYMERGTLKNRPVAAIEQASKLGDKGDIILADPTQYLGIDKGGMQGDVSIHVRFLYDESCFRFIYRFNGAPRKNAAVASYKNASFTTSPFITLDERA